MMEFDSPANNNRVTENVVLPFVLENSGIRGRFVRLNSQVNNILTGHSYPEIVSQLLGEMLVLVSMIGSMLKLKGMITIQAQGDGAVGFITVDYNAEGHLRGYAHIKNAEEIEKISIKSTKNQDIKKIFGAGVVIITIEEPNEKPYQSIVQLDGKNLASCIADYFRKSDQIDISLESTALKEDGRWRAGGIILQRIPEEGGWHKETKEKNENAWQEAGFLMQTVSEQELIDKATPMKEVLFRLFHEGGVRVFKSKNLEARCRCSREKMHKSLFLITKEEREELKVDNKIAMKCHFCSKEEVFTDEDLI